MGSKEYMDDRLPGHQAAVDKVRRLFEEKANPLNKKSRVQCAVRPGTRKGRMLTGKPSDRFHDWS